MNRPRNHLHPPLEFPTRPLSAAQSPAPARRSGTDPRTVLVVDDQHVVLELVDAFLEDSGYRVFLAGGGLQALEICQRIGPEVDLLLTDVRMPGMNGPELYQRLVERHPHVRVLFMSGFQASQARGYGVPKGAPLLVKPFRPAELMERMRQVLRGPARLAGAAAPG